MHKVRLTLMELRWVSVCVCIVWGLYTLLYRLHDWAVSFGNKGCVCVCVCACMLLSFPFVSAVLAALQGTSGGWTPAALVLHWSLHKLDIYKVELGGA